MSTTLKLKNAVFVFDGETASFKIFFVQRCHEGPAYPFYQLYKIFILVFRQGADGSPSPSHLSLIL